MQVVVSAKSRRVVIFSHELIHGVTPIVSTGSKPRLVLRTDVVCGKGVFGSSSFVNSAKSGMALQKNIFNHEKKKTSAKRWIFSGILM